MSDSTQLQLEREITNLIETGIEDMRVPDAIAAHADKRAGKPVTVKDAEQLEAQLGIPVRISKRYGMTQVAWALGTGQNPWLDERTLLIAHGDTGIRWPHAVNLRLKNPAYFEARDARNAQRRELLAEQHKMDRIPVCNPSYVEQAADAIVMYQRARETLKKLIDFGAPLHVISSEIRTLAGKEPL
jgi:hypothetical protein